jgi:hypothetical protein
LPNELSPTNPRAGDSPADKKLFRNWSEFHSFALLTVATLLCLLPFVNKAFHMDDPLFVWTAQHIAGHPLDPYGFRVVWYATETPISDITKNPPLASYYAAFAGSLFGWSERALHIAFLFPTLIVVLGTYRLARHFTAFPVLAAAITLGSPGFLVSSTTLMCDVTMLALWIVAILLWLVGLQSQNHLCLIAAAILIAAGALTKYFGVALIPLLFFYTLHKQRRLGSSLFYLFIPALALAAYQYWTHGLYGRGLLSDAVQYASLHDRANGPSIAAKSMVGLAFAGGCAIPALFLAPLLWTRKWLVVGLLSCGFAGLTVIFGWVHIEAPLAAPHWRLVSTQLAVFIAGGISVVGLVFAGIWRRSDPETVLLALWAAGTLVFATFVNWTINARSILPMIPAIGILIARQLESRAAHSRHFSTKLAATVLSSTVLTIWVTQSDANLANAGRIAANTVFADLRNSDTPIYFEGHWGFQYYMQQFGAKPADLRHTPFHSGDYLIIPENTTNSFGPPPGFQLDGSLLQFDLPAGVITMSQPVGAGFYASVWGPLPYAFAPVPPERYFRARLVRLPQQNDPFASLPKPVVRRSQ